MNPSLLLTKLKKIGFFLALVVTSHYEIYAQLAPFNLTNLDFNGFSAPEQGTSLKFGPDGRLYLAQLNGQIKIYTIEKLGPNTYQVIAAEVLLDVQNIPNHDDIGTLAWDGRSNRQVTGILVKGTAAQPIVYVSSSDPKWGGPTGDFVLDTNSGIITRLTKTINGWESVDIVRGLPRSEENHSTNGLEYAIIQGKPYLLVANGGFTNAGAPSKNFAWITEYALSASVLSIDLETIESLPVQVDPISGRSFIYDLPTLDDPSRANVNGVYDPNDPNYDGVDIGDPFGGNDGLNMAMLVPGSPVQIFSAGYRNTYDLVVTQNGRVYLTDNGPNANWGGLPINEGDPVNVSNDFPVGEPGGNETKPVVVNGFPQYVTNQDQLIKITDNIQNYTFGSFYGGHPTPIRANPGIPYVPGSNFPFSPGGAGLYVRSLGDDNGWQNIQPLFTPNQFFRTQILAPIAPGEPGFDAYASTSLPANWPPVHPSLANPAEADYIAPDLYNPNGPQPDVVAILKRNSNAIDEYRSNAFQGALNGVLVIGRASRLHFVHLKADGSLKFIEEDKLAFAGTNALGVYCMSDEEAFPGTIWVASFNNMVRIFTPADANYCPSPDDLYFDPDADYDGDGYSNQDEIDNGTDYCSGGSRPDDFDGDFESDLNDLDDDDDEILDSDDPFQIGDPSNLPIRNELFSDKSDALGRQFGYRGLGLTGFMNNGAGKPNWLAWLDSVGKGPLPDDIYGGAAGAVQIAAAGGTANGSQNNLTKGFQFGALVSNASGPTWITSSVLGLTGPQMFYDIVHSGEIGIQFGDGTQSNFFKLVFTKSGIHASLEIEDEVDPEPLFLPIPVEDQPTESESILFMLLIDPQSGKVFPKVKIGERDTLHLGEKELLGNVLLAVQSENHPLAIGMFGSSGIPGVEFLATYDNFNVSGEQPFIVQKIQNLQRQAGSIPKEINLSPLFGDNAGEPNLTYTVNTDGHSGLSAQILERKLRLEFPLTSGDAMVTVRATDSKGYFVEQTFQVKILDPESILYRINAGGSNVPGANQAPNWQQNSGNGNLSGFGYTVNSGISMSSQLSWNQRANIFPEYIDEVTFGELFQKHREAEPGQNMVFSIPISNGQYKIRMYWGIENGSLENPGDRLMTIRANDLTLEADLDVLSEFGKGVAGTKTYDITIQNGTLILTFESQTGNAFIHAIELIGKQVSPPIVITQFVEDQVSVVGEQLDGNLFVKAEGGQGALQYYADNLPPGIEIESVNGRIFGTVEPSALPNSPYWVTLRIKDSNAPYANEEEFSFQWTINPPVNPLVGHWKMEEGGGNSLIDHSGKGNNGTLQTTANVSWVPGKEGLGLRLNGWANRFAVIPHSSSLEIPNALTIAAWVNPSALHRGTILSKSSGNGFEFWLDINGHLEFRLNRGNSGASYVLRSNYNYSQDLGKWIHLAATFNGTTMKIFVNGVQNTSKSFSPFEIGTLDGNLILGALSTTQRFNGILDEVRLYNNVLTGAQIFELVNGTLPAPTAPALLGPNTGSSSTVLQDVPLTWESSTLAEGYQIQISENPSFSSFVVNSDVQETLSYLPIDLPVDVPLYWRVRAYNASGNSPWSVVWNFTKTYPILHNNLVGFWKMEEGGGSVLIDHSGHTNDGTLQNSTNVFWVEGRDGLALQLNGWSNRFALVPHSTSLEIPTGLTIAAWVKPATLHRGTILYKSAGNGFELWLDNNGQIEFRLNRASNGSTYRLRSNFKYNSFLGSWIHVAATFDGSSMKIFINGSEDTGQTYTPFNIGTNSGNLVIGALGTIQRFNGQLDEVQLYNNALSPVEIYNIANHDENHRILAQTHRDIDRINAISENSNEEASKNQINDHILSLKLYPNPAKNLLQVDNLWITDGTLSVQIWDMQGRLWFEKSVDVNQRRMTLDLRAMKLIQGNYVISFKDNLQIQQIKFMKD